MPEPVKAPVKGPSTTPVVDPERHVREICPEQTRRHMDPWIIAPD